MFIDILKKKGINPNDYLNIVQMIADKYGYDKNLLTYSDNPKKKLSYNNINFGSSVNNDFIIYLLKTNEENALEKRKNYLARAYNIRGDWRTNSISPNNLAIRILWIG